MGTDMGMAGMGNANYGFKLMDIFAVNSAAVKMGPRIR